MPMRKLKEFLDSNDADYITIVHPAAYTAQEVADICRIPEKNMAKTVMLNMDGHLAMAVLPADKKMDTRKLQHTARAHHVALAKEEEFVDIFPDCEPGAMPPFGNLFGMDVFVDESLREDLEIAFNAGAHDELISMSYNQYEQLVHPMITDMEKPEPVMYG